MGKTGSEGGGVLSQILHNKANVFRAKVLQGISLVMGMVIIIINIIIRTNIL